MVSLHFTGNADGLGETRKKELVKSGMHLGLRDEDDVFVVDSPYVAAASPFLTFLLSLFASSPLCFQGMDSMLYAMWPPAMILLLTN
jgi:hypothetical protein